VRRWLVPLVLTVCVRSLETVPVLDCEVSCESDLENDGLEVTDVETVRDFEAVAVWGCDKVRLWDRESESDAVSLPCWDGVKVIDCVVSDETVEVGIVDSEAV